MIDEAALRARAAERCKCSHERSFHDSCSRCYCPFFLPERATDKALLRAWRTEAKVREIREAD